MLIDLDDFYQGADDFLASGEVGFVQALTDLGSEVIEMAEDQSQLLALGLVIGGCGGLGLEPLQSFAGFGDAGFELAFFEQATLIGIDQATDAALDHLDLFLNLFQVNVGFLIGSQSSFKFLLEILRILKQGADIVPDDSVESVESHGAVRARFGSAEAE